MSSSYTFNNMGRIGSDTVDNSQQNLYNTRFSDYLLANYHGENNSIDTQVKFASQQPTFVATGIATGTGLDGSVIDIDSKLMLNTEQDRSYSKLELMQRPFLTVPYLGRGSCDTIMESKLQQGENISERKSVNLSSEKPQMDFNSYPMIESLKDKLTNPSFLVEESAMDGWVRGGVASRESANDSEFSKNYRPKNNL